MGAGGEKRPKGFPITKIEIGDSCGIKYCSYNMSILWNRLWN
ncbi:protein of unknown function [Methanocaldococcus lauensis]|uniref:Uncharacterized protein n=1 Tax=Methanocaldococcus lauensis TaxID=2546128 RepID=A0A8D6PRZ7_9EURY|nr:protein of unknown function [Methanocaldococcus lauensis]